MDRQRYLPVYSKKVEIILIQTQPDRLDTRNDNEKHEARTTEYG